MNDYTILEKRQLEDGTCNDNPNTVFHVRLEDGREGWAAGPHGVNCDAVHDWLSTCNELAETADEAIASGCE